MFKKIIIIVLSLILSINIFASNNNIQNSLLPFFGKIDTKNIIQTEFKGISEVILTEPTIESIFVSSDGKFLIQGDIIDLNKRIKMAVSLKVINLKKILIDTVKDKDKIIFKAKNQKHIINVFTDVDCPFCVKLHANMKSMNDAGITVKYLASPLASLHPKAQQQMEKIWCAKDKIKAMDNYKRKKIIPNSSKCDNPVAEQLKLAQKLGVNGTPAIFLGNGEVISGYLPVKTLLKRIEDSKK